MPYENGTRERVCETGKEILQITYIYSHSCVYRGLDSWIFHRSQLADFLALIQAFLSSLLSFFILINHVLRQGFWYRMAMPKHGLWDSVHQRESMGLLDYQAMPSLRDVPHVGVLCTFNNRSAPYRGKWCGPYKAGGMDIEQSNHTLLGHFPPACRAGRRVGPAL